MVRMCRISPDGTTLTVFGAHATDGGTYACVATNAAGEEDRIFNLNVYGELKFHFSPWFFRLPRWHEGLILIFELPLETFQRLL